MVAKQKVQVLPETRTDAFLGEMGPSGEGEGEGRLCFDFLEGFLVLRKSCSAERFLLVTFLSFPRGGAGVEDVTDWTGNTNDDEEGILEDCKSILVKS